VPRWKRAGGRRGKKKGSRAVLWVGIAAAVAVLAGGAALFVFSRAKGPGPGATALGLLPASTEAAAELEDVGSVERELARFSGAGQASFQEALSAYKNHVREWLVRGAGISEEQAAAVLAATRSFGLGLVPVQDGKKGPPTLVALLALADSGKVVGQLKLQPEGAPVSGVQIYKGKAFLALLGSVLVVCERQEPLGEMAKAFAGGGAGSLGQVAQFIAARTADAGKGRAWCYVTGPGLQDGAAKLVEFLPLKQLSVMSALVPDAQYVSAWANLKGPQVAAHGVVQLPRDRTEYDRRRLEPKAFSVTRYVPATASTAVILSLDNPAVAAERLLDVLNGAYRERFSGDVTGLIRRLEIMKGGRLAFATDVLPLLAGEAGFFELSGAKPAKVLVLTVSNADGALRVADVIAGKLSGKEPAPVSQGGLSMRKTAGTPPVWYAMMDGAFVLSDSADGLLAVTKAMAEKATMADNAVFRAAAAALPAASTLLMAVEPGAAGDADGGEPCPLIVSASMGAAEMTLDAVLPSGPGYVIAMAPKGVAGPERAAAAAPAAPSDSTMPAATARPARSALEASQDNLAGLVALCRTFLKEKGNYPAGLADLVRQGYFKKKPEDKDDPLALLTRPGDPSPAIRPGLPVTSYEMAFDALPTHKFAADTPAALPMIWELVAAHDGKRLVAYFDGTVKLKSTSREEFLKQLRAAFPAEADKPAAPEPPAKPEEGAGNPAPAPGAEVPAPDSGNPGNDENPPGPPMPGRIMPGAPPDAGDQDAPADGGEEKKADDALNDAL